MGILIEWYIGLNVYEIDIQEYLSLKLSQFEEKQI